MRWQIANKAHSTGLAIIISYPTSMGGIIVLLKTPPKYRKLNKNKSNMAPKIHASAYHICRA